MNNLQNSNANINAGNNVGKVQPASKSIAKP